jgi:hypothetical protein
MSDAVEKTAAGATRGLFGILAFVLLMVGIEGMTGAVQLPSGLGFWLILLGAICVYAAFFWETAKKVLSIEAQVALGRFAQSRMTWFGMLFLVLATIILSPFIEQHRWPFSYPVDPSVGVENDNLKRSNADLVGQLGSANEIVQKWKFIHELRNYVGDQECHYYLNPTDRVRVAARSFGNSNCGTQIGKEA